MSSERTTADWNGGEPETGSATWYTGPDRHVWARRKVRSDGTVRFLRHAYRPPDDCKTPPMPGEWLLLFNYGDTHNAERAARGLAPTCGEWTAPADPDGYIRREFWEIVRGEDA